MYDFLLCVCTLNVCLKRIKHNVNKGPSKIIWYPSLNCCKIYFKEIGKYNYQFCKLLTESYTVVNWFYYLKSKLHSLVIMQGCKLDMHINLLILESFTCSFSTFMYVFSKNIQILFAFLLPWITGASSLCQTPM